MAVEKAFVYEMEEELPRSCELIREASKILDKAGRFIFDD
jgi:hypothetical protein